MSGSLCFAPLLMLLSCLSHRNSKGKEQVGKSLPLSHSGHNCSVTRSLSANPADQTHCLTATGYKCNALPFPCTPAEPNRELKTGKDCPSWGTGQSTHTVDLSFVLAKSFGSGGTLGTALVGGYLENFSLKRDRIPISSWHQIGTWKWSRKASLDLVLSVSQFRKERFQVKDRMLLHHIPLVRAGTALCVFDILPSK